MIKLFPQDATEEQLKTNGIAILDNAITENSVQEVKNGQFSFDFEYSSSGKYSNLIEGNMIVVATTPHGEQPFRIYDIIEHIGYLEVQCNHLFYDLADDFIEDTNLVNLTGTNVMGKLNSTMQYPSKFRFSSDIDKVANARIVRMNPVEMLLDTGKDNSFISRWGGELIRDGYDVKLLKDSGIDNGYKIKHGKNLTGYDYDIDYQQVVTRIMPYGFDGLMIPEKYVDSPIINDYSHIKIKKVEYKDVKAISENSTVDQDDALPLEDAYAELRRLAKKDFEVNNFDKPQINIKIKFKHLGDTKEYEQFKKLQHIGIWDKVHIQLPNVEVVSKILSYKFNAISKKYTEIVLGTETKKSIIQQGNDTSSKVDEVDNKVDDVSKNVEETKDKVSNDLKEIRSDLNDYDEHIKDLGGQINDTRDDMFNFINQPGDGVIKFSPDRDNPTDMTIESSSGSRFRLNSRGIMYDGTGKTAMDSQGRIYADQFVGQKIAGVYIEGGEIHGARLTGDSQISLTGGGGNIVSITNYGISTPALTVYQIDGVQAMNIVNSGYLMIAGVKLTGDGTGRLYMGGLRVLNESDLK